MNYDDEFHFLVNFFPKDSEYNDTLYQNTVNEFKKSIRDKIVIKFY